MAGFFKRAGGWNPPFLKHCSVAPTIFNLQQQSASHMKVVMFSFHLIPWWGCWSQLFGKGRKIIVKILELSIFELDQHAARQEILRLSAIWTKIESFIYENFGKYWGLWFSPQKICKFLSNSVRFLDSHSWYVQNDYLILSPTSFLKNSRIFRTLGGSRANKGWSCESWWVSIGTKFENFVQAGCRDSGSHHSRNVYCRKPIILPNLVLFFGTFLELSTSTPFHYLWVAPARNGSHSWQKSGCIQKSSDLFSFY